jgi:hypothetical protein
LPSYLKAILRAPWKTGDPLRYAMCCTKL